VIRWGLSLLLITGVIGFLIAARWPTTVEVLAPLHELPKTEKLTEAGLKLLVVLGWPLTILLAGLLIFSALRDRLSSAGLDPGRLLSAAGRATRWRDLGVQLAFRDRFKEALTEVTSALGRRTLTILIDDLDRCQPDQIAEVLEAINFLTDTDGCFVVFGFARPQVLAGIGLAHREIAAELAGAEDTPVIRKAYAEDFLRKLIQIEVPVPRFGAPAAERLVDAASDIAAEPRAPRAWLPALAVLCLLFLAGIGMWAGERLYSIGEEAWNAAPPAPTQQAHTPGLAGIKTAPPTPDLKQPLPPSREVASSYFYPGETAPLPHWVWFILVPVLGAGVFAAMLAARRPQATSDDDTELFTKALHHWAVAAFTVRQSPREMKRFLNRLRFAAAGRARDLSDDILVGLAVLEHAGADAELTGVINNGASGLRNAIGARTVTDARANAAAVFELIYKALTPDELAASGLPPFEPTPAQVKAFLALWEGVRVEE
jgi:KAP family P-loop domain